MSRVNEPVQVRCDRVKESSYTRYHNVTFNQRSTGYDYARLNESAFSIGNETREKADVPLLLGFAQCKLQDRILLRVVLIFRY